MSFLIPVTRNMHQRNLTAMFGSTGLSHADPSFRINVEGAFYGTSNETWFTPVSQGTTRLWVIGLPVTKGDITNAKLVAADDAANGVRNVNVTLKSSTTGRYGGAVVHRLRERPSISAKTPAKQIRW